MRGGMLARLGIALALAACAPSVPTPAEQQRALDRADADRLAATLAALPGVVLAHAELARPVADPFAPGPASPAGRAEATIVVTATAGADAAAVTAAARALAALAGAPDAHVIVTAAPPAAAAQALVRVGPFDVAADSAPRLRLTLFVLLGVIAAVAASVIARYARRSGRRGNRPQ
jgi:hypothetical protein